MPKMLAVANSTVSLASAAHTRRNILCYTRYSIVQNKLSNKQSAKVMCGFDRLRTAPARVK